MSLASTSWTQNGIPGPLSIIIYGLFYVFLGISQQPPTHNWGEISTIGLLTSAFKPCS